MGRYRVCAWALVPLMIAFASGAEAEESAASRTKLYEHVTQGALRTCTETGEIVDCPLKHTEVRAFISGFIARVRVIQTFTNHTKEKIEAVYVFPLPHNAAVDDMTMVVGSRRMVGEIRRRAEARHIYQQAISRGQTASLLEQERPNIFTQSVGNIRPRQEVRIEISYVTDLDYDLGTYEFHFPMVVGPRYIPGKPTSAKPDVQKELKGKVGEVAVPAPAKGQPSGTGWSPDTDRVPDASRITPPVLRPGVRNGHDVSLSVDLNAGVPIQDLRVPSHRAGITKRGPACATVILSPDDAIPNKDFILRYDVSGKRPELCVLTHSPVSADGFFMLMLQPKALDTESDVPRELVFLIDVSGSMRGEPTAEVRWALREFLERVKPTDTIQIVTFAGEAQKLFEKPLPATRENRAKAAAYSQSQEAGGGTEMLSGVREALNQPLDPGRVRIVVMLTDGFIGNEREIVSEVGLRCGDKIRFWTVGIGSAPNRYLIDGVARQGGGLSAVLQLKEDPGPVVGRIMRRVHRAQMTDVQIDWGNLIVAETYPVAIPELWAGRPIVLFGRYLEPGEGTVTLNGDCEGEPVSLSAAVHFPETNPENDVLSKVWARKRIADLFASMYTEDVPGLIEEIVRVALEFRLMSPYTSFVAVDESERGEMQTPARPPRRMTVPIPIPEGVRFDWIFTPVGAKSESAQSSASASKAVGDAVAGIDPKLPEAEVLKANLYTMHGRPAEAYAQFRKDGKAFVGSIQHVSPRTVHLIAERLIKEKRIREAINLCRHFQIQHAGDKQTPVPASELAKTQLLLGDAYFADERYEIARDEYATILTSWPDTREAIDAKFKVGETLLYQKIFAKAEEIFEDLEGSKDPEVATRAGFMLARLYLQTCDADKARAKLLATAGIPGLGETPDLLKYGLAIADAERREAQDALRLIGAYSGGSLRVRETRDGLRITCRDRLLAGSRTELPLRVRTASGQEGIAALTYSEAGAGLWAGEFHMPAWQRAHPQRPKRFANYVAKKLGPRFACDVALPAASSRQTTGNDPSVMYFEASKQLMNSDAAKATALFRQLSSEHPDSKWAKYARGRLTAPVFDRIAEMDDDDDDEPKQLSKACEHLGLSDEAVRERGKIPQRLLLKASQVIEKGDLRAARVPLQLACLHSLAAMSVDPFWKPHPLLTASQTLMSLDDRLAQEEAEKAPALARRLSLVIRNRPLPEALADLAKAGRVTIKLVEGSEGDARRLLLRDELKVTYLDLRGATVAEALNWLLEPYHLTWRPNKRGKVITVGTPRRLPGVSPWVYDVAKILFPLSTELGEAREARAEVTGRLIKKGVGGLLPVVRSMLDSEDQFGVEPGSATLMDLSQLMVLGTPEEHQKVLSLLDGLVRPGTDLAAVLPEKLGTEERGGLKWLQQVAPTRSAAYAIARKCAVRRAAQRRAISTLTRYAWRLPTAALAGEEDEEALLHCGAAWGDVTLSEIENARDLLALTCSAYTAQLSLLANPNGTATKTLAERAAGFLPELLQSAKKLRDRGAYGPMDRLAKLAQVYAILAGRAAGRAELPLDLDPDQLQMSGQGCASAYLGLTPEESMLLQTQSLGESIMKYFLSTMQEGTLQEDDVFVLKALAAKRCGGEVWQAFRRAKLELIKTHRPSESAILFINRLAGSKKTLRTEL